VIGVSYLEVPLSNKNIAEVARILAICYNEYNTVKDEILSKFTSEQVTKIKSLAADPPSPPIFPESLKQLLKTNVNEVQ
jgi:hypothetical protein